MNDPDAGFKDHFSDRAEGYARYRPRYPDALFAALAEAAPATELAWDCATGSGQAALGLAGHFAGVIATDASADQIANAAPHPRVRYRVGREAASGLPDASVDLVTVAQAFHWLDAERFWPEARRVLRPGGIVAIWMYRLTRITPPIDAILDRFYGEVVGPWWPPERRHVENGYADLPFPIRALPLPEPPIVARWDLDRFCGYVRTWSATRRAIAARGQDPVDGLHRQLAGLWGDGEREVRWPLRLRAGAPR